MKALMLAVSCLALTLSIFGQNPPPRSPVQRNAESAWTNIPQGFPPKSGRAPSAQSTPPYPTDYFILTTYGAPGILILGNGDEFNGTIGAFTVCDIWRIDGLSGIINWNDSSPASTTP